MKHAGASTLRLLNPLLSKIRAVPGLVERKPGIFYKKSIAVLHFHEDPTGLFADLKEGNEFRRLAVNTRSEQERLVKRIQSVN